MNAVQQKRMARQEKILLSLDKLTYATREQLQIIERLGGDRNANRILRQLEKDKLISSIKRECKIYYLSGSGQEYIGSTKGKLKKEWIQHTLMRNDLYIRLGMPKSWEKEKPVTWGDDKLIPDARFKNNGIYHFVEIDNTQTMRSNIDKIKKYKSLSNAIFNQYRHRPVLIWCTVSEIRKNKLEEACKKHGVKYLIYGNI